MNKRCEEYVKDAITGYFLSYSISAFVRLGVADALENQKVTSHEIAKKLNIDPSNLHRLMIYLSSEGFLKINKKGQFFLSETGAYLTISHPNSLSTMAEFFGSELHSSAWSELTDSVRTGESAIFIKHGTTLFEYLSNHKNESDLFNRAMGGQIGPIRYMAHSFPFNQYKKIVDVGGGRGAFLREITRAHAEVHGVLYDLPRVINEIEAEVASDIEVNKKISLCGGSFFEHIPSDADLYVFKLILHDWSDTDCLRILNVLSCACKKGSSLLVVERLVDVASLDSYSCRMDMEMMVLTESGRERTLEEYRVLLNKSGFELAEVNKFEAGMYGLLAKRV
jgi:predicted transcriptional regulator